MSTSGSMEKGHVKAMAGADWDIPLAIGSLKVNTIYADGAPHIRVPFHDICKLCGEDTCIFTAVC